MWYVGSAVSAGILAALAAVSPVIALVAIVLIATAFFVAKNPDRVIYLTVACATMALPAFIPSEFSVGPFNLRIYEPLLSISVIYVALRYRGRMPLVGILFGIMIVAWSTIGLASGHEPSKLIYDIRNLIMLLAAFYVAQGIAGTHVVTGVFSWVKGILWLSAGLSILASTVGLPLNGRVEEASLPVAGASAASDAAVRLLTPATHLSTVVLCVLAVLLIMGRARLKSMIPFATPALLMVFISFSRNTLLAIGVAFVFALIASRSARGVWKTVVYLLGVTAVFGLLAMSSPALVSLPGGNWVSTQIQGFSNRVLEGLTSSTLEVDLSSQFRVVFENALIIPRIEESPLFGHGFGYAYKPPLGIPGTFNSDFAPYYAHNFYLWILVKAGVTGLAIFLWFSLAPILKTFRQSSGLAHASAGAATALLACSFVVPMPIGSPTALLLGALLGAAAAFSSVDSKTPTHAKFHSRHKIRQLNH